MVKKRATLVRAQWIAVIRSTRCYRTVSDVTALALGGTPPLDLLARGELICRTGLSAMTAMEKRTMKKEERART